MKKLFLALLAVASITAANAQKGSILVFGSAGASKDNAEVAPNVETETRSWHIQPGVGYQFHDNMTAGLEGGYRYDAIEHEFNILNTRFTQLDDASEWNLGAFYRYTHYFNQTFSVWGQAGVGYLNGDIATDALDTIGGELTNTTFVRDYSGFRAYIMPSFAINVHNGWALNFGFGGIEYRNTSFDEVAGFEQSGSSLNFTFGQQLNVGISKNIGCFTKKKAPKEPGMDTRAMKPETEDDEDEE